MNLNDLTLAQVANLDWENASKFNAYVRLGLLEACSQSDVHSIEYFDEIYFEEAVERFNLRIVLELGRLSHFLDTYEDPELSEVSALDWEAGMAALFDFVEYRGVDFFGREHPPLRVSVENSAEIAAILIQLGSKRELGQTAFYRNHPFYVGHIETYDGVIEREKALPRAKDVRCIYLWDTNLFF